MCRMCRMTPSEVCEVWLNVVVVEFFQMKILSPYFLLCFVYVWLKPNLNHEIQSAFCLLIILDLNRLALNFSFSIHLNCFLMAFVSRINNGWNVFSSMRKWRDGSSQRVSRKAQIAISVTLFLRPTHFWIYQLNECGIAGTV